MNKSHITDEQVEMAINEWSIATRISIDELSHEDAEGVRRNMRTALEAAFPEPSIQELLRDEERSARHDDTQQPAAFGQLVVSYEMAEQVMRDIDSYPAHDCVSDLQQCIQHFVNKHSIKPMSVHKEQPEEQTKILAWDAEEHAWKLWHYANGVWPGGATHWLPASALPIPEPAAVDAKEAAWREYCSDWRSVGVKANRLDFLAGYEAGQAGGNK